MADGVLQDQQRFPLLDEAGARMLRRLRQHPNAPIYNWHNGERLTAEGLATLRSFASQSRVEPVSADWSDRFVASAVRDVPFYRERADVDSFDRLPLLTRDQIARQPWAFVPDAQPIEDLITYTTSGTTGTRLQYLATPQLPARYLPLMQFALATVGVELRSGPDEVAIMHICAQRGTVVLHSVSNYLGGAGFVKINLDPADWREPADVVAFIEDCNPSIYTGDPFAFAQLAALPVAVRPRAMISSATSLTDEQRRLLHKRFSCPVVDLYSMNETGPIAFSTERSDEHELFTGHLHVEIVASDGSSCPDGVFGQIVVTGGLNDCLPLIRYATGDFAAIGINARGRRCLRGLHARSPVWFQTRDGRRFNSVDVATALVASPLSAVEIVQRADASIQLRYRGEPSAAAEAAERLRMLFGDGQRIDLVPDTAAIQTAKRMTYRCEMIDG